MNEIEKKNLTDVAKRVRLTEEEHASIRRVLLTYTLEHPKLEKEYSPYARLMSWDVIRRPLPAAVFASLIILVSGGGVSFAAEQALPGDPLYPVKVSVNENVRLFLATTDEAKAVVETDRATRRLEEAEELVKCSGFDMNTRSEVEREFEVQTERLKSRITVLKDMGKADAAEEVSLNFEAALQAHGEILTNLSVTASSTKSEKQNEIESLRKKVTIQKQDSVSERSEDEQKRSVNINESRDAALRGMRAALKKIEEVKGFVRLRSSALGKNAVAGADSRFSLALRTVSEGEAKFKFGSYAEALRLFQRAYRLTEEIKPLVNARQNLKIDVPLNADVGGENEEDVKNDDRGESEDSGPRSSINIRGGIRTGIKLGF